MITSGVLGLDLDVRNVDEPSGIAIVLPGFLDSADYPASTSLADALAADGFTTVRLDPRGSWRNRRAVRDYLTTNHVQDLRRLLDRTTEFDRVALVGYCYGAFVASLAAALDRRVTDLVALMPTRSFIWPSDYDAGRDRWRLQERRDFVRPDPAVRRLTRISIPHAAVADAQRYDMPRALEILRCRSLFVAGERDTVIPPEAVEDLHRTCGSPAKDFVSLPVGHDYSEDPAELADVNKAVVHWLEQVTSDTADHAADLQQPRHSPERAARAPY